MFCFISPLDARLLTCQLCSMESKIDCSFAIQFSFWLISLLGYKFSSMSKRFAKALWICRVFVNYVWAIHSKKNVGNKKKNLHVVEKKERGKVESRVIWAINIYCVYACNFIYAFKYRHMRMQREHIPWMQPLRPCIFASFETKEKKKYMS